MGKTFTKPKAVTSKSSGIKPYLEKAKTSFPNMMRRVTQTARDWRQKKKHSEMMKPYLMDPDLSWPALEDIAPTPLPLESPHIDAEDWTNINQIGEEAYRFKCIIHCRHKAGTTEEGCEYPIKCSFGAWTPVPNGGLPDRWKWYITSTGAKDDDVTLEGEWKENEGLNGEVWFTVKDGDWMDLVAGDGTIKLTMVYYDKGQAEGKYYHPKMRKWIVILGGKSICDDDVIVKCQACPADPNISFDDGSTPDTINKNSNITCYVAGGKSSYTWSVVGTGYSLDYVTTTGLSNVLNCVDGACGTEYDAYCTVTVEDDCGETVSFKIRNADGADWVQVEARSHNLTGSNCNSSEGDTCLYSPDSYDIVDEEEKWVVEGFGVSNCRYDGSTPPALDAWASGDYPPPTCDGPMDCHPDSHTSVCPGDGVVCGCFADRYTYYTWGC